MSSNNNFENDTSFSCGDVLQLLGVPFNPGKVDQDIICPVCGEKRFGMNLVKEFGHCRRASCGFRANKVSYYARMMNMTNGEAKRDIKRRLNIPDERTGKLPERFVMQENKTVHPLAPIEVRDAVYRILLDELILSDKHRDSLLARGFSNDDIWERGYKSYPDPAKVEYTSLCKRVLSRIAESNSDSETATPLTLKGVPGFFTLKSGDWCLPKRTLGILVPQVDAHNRIHGLQIRKDDDLRKEVDGELESKYCWLSTPNYTNGSGITQAVHLACDFKWDDETKQYNPFLHNGIVTLTEGGMKADLVNALMESQGHECSVISIPGVNALKPLKDALTELKAYGLTTVNLAFDMDYLTNPNVKEAMVATQRLIKSLNLNCESIMNWQYKMEDSDGVFYLKGLDDFYAYAFKHIRPKVISK